MSKSHKVLQGFVRCVLFTCPSEWSCLDRVVIRKITRVGENPTLVQLKLAFNYNHFLSLSSLSLLPSLSSSRATNVILQIGIRTTRRIPSTGFPGLANNWALVKNATPFRIPAKRPTQKLASTPITKQVPIGWGQNTIIWFIPFIYLPQSGDIRYRNLGVHWWLFVI